MTRPRRVILAWSAVFYLAVFDAIAAAVRVVA